MQDLTTIKGDRWKKSVSNCWSLIVLCYGFFLILSLFLVKQVFMSTDLYVIDVLWEGINKYKDNIFWSNRIDAIQREFSCCGVTSAEDWFETNWYNTLENAQINKSEDVTCDVKTVPLSCCFIKNSRPCIVKDVYPSLEMPLNVAFEKGCCGLLVEQCYSYSQTCIVILALILTSMILNWILQRMLLNHRTSIKDVNGTVYTWIFPSLPLWVYGKQIKSFNYDAIILINDSLVDENKYLKQFYQAETIGKTIGGHQKKKIDVKDNSSESNKMLINLETGLIKGKLRFNGNKIPSGEDNECEEFELDFFNSPEDQLTQILSNTFQTRSKMSKVKMNKLYDSVNTVCGANLLQTKSASILPELSKPQNKLQPQRKEILTVKSITHERQLEKQFSDNKSFKETLKPVNLIQAFVDKIKNIFISPRGNRCSEQIDEELQNLIPKANTSEDKTFSNFEIKSNTKKMLEFDNKSVTPLHIPPKEDIRIYEGQKITPGHKITKVKCLANYFEVHLNTELTNHDNDESRVKSATIDGPHDQSKVNTLANYYERLLKLKTEEQFNREKLSGSFIRGGKTNMSLTDNCLEDKISKTYHTDNRSESEANFDRDNQPKTTILVSLQDENKINVPAENFRLKQTEDLVALAESDDKTLYNYDCNYAEAQLFTTSDAHKVSKDVHTNHLSDEILRPFVLNPFSTNIKGKNDHEYMDTLDSDRDTSENMEIDDHDCNSESSINLLTFGDSGMGFTNDFLYSRLNHNVGPRAILDEDVPFDFANDWESGTSNYGETHALRTNCGSSTLRQELQWNLFEYIRQRRLRYQKNISS